MYSHIIGIDEAGRGPLAGPVTVGAVCVPPDFDWSGFPGLTDSKKLSETRREALFQSALEAQKAGALTFAVAKVSAPVIDRIGIGKAVTRGIVRTLERIDRDPETVHVKLDGLLKAPAAYQKQETIIKGDVTEPEISLASIVAKVTRDRYMVRMARQYAGYGFEKHKGYGTREHTDAIKKITPCAQHRMSFLKQV